MKSGEFKINGVSSREFNAYIQERPSIPSARRKLNVKQIPGVSGDYIFDEGAFDNVPFSLSLYTVGKSEGEIRDNRQRVVDLFNAGTYQDLELYHDPDYVYEVIMLDSIEFSPDGKTPLILEFSLSLSAKPFKKVKDVRTHAGRTLTITNPYNYPSFPEIKIFGEKDLSLHVNGEEFPFKEIDGHVTLDSQAQQAFKDTGVDILNRNDKMHKHDFPVLQPGSNSLSVTGGATRLEVNPRWVVKI